MSPIIRNAMIVAGIGGALAIGAAVPSQAQYYRYGPTVHVSPYAHGAYAYVPGYRHWYWQPPVQYDTGGAPIPRGNLGWHGGPPTGAPANPCYLGQAMQNRC
jgi:hypothetical protein